MFEIIVESALTEFIHTKKDLLDNIFCHPIAKDFLGAAYNNQNVSKHKTTKNMGTLTFIEWIINTIENSQTDLQEQKDEKTNFKETS